MSLTCCAWRQGLLRNFIVGKFIARHYSSRSYQYRFPQAAAESIIQQQAVAIRAAWFACTLQSIFTWHDSLPVFSNFKIICLFSCSFIIIFIHIYEYSTQSCYMYIPTYKYSIVLYRVLCWWFFRAKRRAGSSLITRFFFWFSAFKRLSKIVCSFGKLLLLLLLHQATVIQL